MSPYDWQYKTEPQKFLTKNKVSPWGQGKVLGGTSQLNYMYYVRGNPRDYDEWSDLGNDGWSYKEVLPFFKKSQNYDVSGPADPEFTGKDGPMGVRTPEDEDCPPLNRIYRELFEGFDMPQVDFNGANQTPGVIRGQVNIQKGGWRADTYSSFAEPHVGKGLTVLTYTHVNHLLFKEGTNHVAGVNANRFQKQLNLFARKEVILAAGVINSPQILMLSGIGPKDHLKSMDIKIQVDLPGVGSNLRHHVLGILHNVIDKERRGEYRRLGAGNFNLVNPWNYLNFFLYGRGPLAVAAGPTGAFFKSQKNKDFYGRPDITVSKYMFLYLPHCQ